MSTTVVVGGGIAGIVCALLSAGRSKRVVLIEKEPELGGLFRSETREVGGSSLSFDMGSHFLRETGIPELDRLIFGQSEPEQWLSLGNLRGGGFYGNALNSSSPFVDAREMTKPQDYSRGLVELIEHCVPRNKEFPDLEGQLTASFGPTLTDSLFRPILEKKFLGCRLSELAPDSHALFGLSKIIALTPDATRKLKNLPGLDATLAFHSSSEGASPLRNFYPRSGGIEAWIKYLQAKLKNAGVEIMTRTAVERLEFKAGTVTRLSLSGRQNIDVTRLIWTIPVPGFLLAAGIPLPEKLSPPRRLYTSIYHFVFDRKFQTDVHYVQCHSPDLKSFRLTLYPNVQPVDSARSYWHLTTEMITPDEPDLELLGKTAEAELRTMGILGAQSRKLHQHSELLKDGFPCPTIAFYAQADKLLDFAKGRFENVDFLGRAAGRSFVTNQVLAQVYQQLGTINDAGANSREIRHGH